MANPKLFMIMLGAKPAGRYIEQHDIFFTVADSIKETVTAIKEFWPEGGSNLHVDAWREVTLVDGYHVALVSKETPVSTSKRLFFINLGGYQENEFDEPHYKLLLAADNMAAAVKAAKETAFYKHTGFKGATSHIDDRYGVDVDDVYEVNDILSEQIKARYQLVLEPAAAATADEIHLGYFQLHKL